MTAKEFLDLLASLSASRLPGNRAHLGAYAGPLAEKVPNHWLCAEMAQKVEPQMLDRMKLPELLAIIRQESHAFPKPESASPRGAVGSDEDRLAERWFEYAQRRMGGYADDQLGQAQVDHLLSLLRHQSPKAWERFAEIHAPDVLEARKAQVAELVARRRGDLPKLGVPSAGKPLPAAQRYARSAIPEAPPAKPVLPSEALNAQLRAAAQSGDLEAADKLRARTGEVVLVPRAVIDSHADELEVAQ